MILVQVIDDYLPDSIKSTKLTLNQAGVPYDFQKVSDWKATKEERLKTVQ